MGFRYLPPNLLHQKNIFRIFVRRNNPLDSLNQLFTLNKLFEEQTFSRADKEKVKQAQKDAYDDAAELVKGFLEKFGELSCIGLVGVDFSDEVAAKKAIEAGILKKCDERIQWVIEKLYELDEKRRVTS